MHADQSTLRDCACICMRAHWRLPSAPHMTIWISHSWHRCYLPPENRWLFICSGTFCTTFCRQVIPSACYRHNSAAPDRYRIVSPSEYPSDKESNFSTGSLLLFRFTVPTLFSGGIKNWQNLEPDKFIRATFLLHTKTKNNATMGVRVFFPNLYMRLVSLNTTRSPPLASFYVPPKMTKHEIKEYLTKIYKVDVTNVNTALFLGKYKRFFSKYRRIGYKRRNFKKAMVEYNPSTP